MDQRFDVEATIYDADAPGLQQALAAVYQKEPRPRCLCVPGAIEMYVARFKDYVVKRMPDTGPKHDPLCPSFECDVAQSGLGALVGEAVIEHAPDSIELRVDFPFQRIPGRTRVQGNGEDVSEVTVQRHRMSLRALMHFLWDHARTANYSKNGQGSSPLKSMDFPRMGFPLFLRDLWTERTCNVRFPIRKTFPLAHRRLLSLQASSTTAWNH
jgi:Protein of unknown function (DUF1173)